MEKIKNIFNRAFTIRNFIILAFVASIIAIIWIKVKENAEQSKVEKRLDNFTMESYENGVEVKFTKVLSRCDVEEEDLEGIVLGVDSDGSGIVRYYIDDKEIINKVMDKLKEITVIGMTDPADEFVEREEDWDIHLYPSNQYFAVRIYGKSTPDTDCYRTSVNAVEKSGFYAKSKWYHNDLWKMFKSETQLVYTKDMEDFIKEILDKYVVEITLDEVISGCSGEKPDMASVFRYKHSSENGDGKLTRSATRVYKFPIKNVNGYFLMEKVEATADGYPKSDILRMEMYNDEGQALNIFEANEEEIRKFLQ